MIINIHILLLTFNSVGGLLLVVYMKKQRMACFNEPRSYEEVSITIFLTVDTVIFVWLLFMMLILEHILKLVAQVARVAPDAETGGKAQTSIVKK